MTRPRPCPATRRIAVHLLSALMFVGVPVSCASDAPISVTERSERFSETIELPKPDLVGSVTLEQALASRRSERAYAPDPLSLEIIGQLLWAGQGVTSDGDRRTAPSAGALYPLQLYAITPGSVLQYRPEFHDAVSRADSGLIDQLPDLAFDQEFLATAPLVLVVTGTVSRTESKYGATAEAFVEREAGHVTQNILLQATVLGLASVPVGGFESDPIERLLLLPTGEEVLYLIAVGLHA